MNIARILYPVRVLGPGNRIGLWLCGCSRGCKNCSNPELWKKRKEYEASTDRVFGLIRRIADSHSVDGFTISGGEPMDQAGELADLLDRVAQITDDVLVYSGYQIEELRTNNDPATAHILDIAAVLIDGEYIDELNDNTALRGSSNQRVHILNPKYSKRYEDYFSVAHNQIQNFTTADGIVSVGIHRRGFRL